MMGLFDSIAGAAISKLSGGGSQGAMVQAAITLFNEHGGLAGILHKFRENGMEAEVASWVGKGKNLPIAAERIQQVVGRNALNDMAKKFDIPADELSRKLAEYLPGVVDKLTPEGKVPKNQTSVLVQALSLLKN